MTEVCSLSSGLYEIAKMSGTTTDDSGRTLLRTWRQVKKISTEIYVEKRFSFNTGPAISFQRLTLTTVT